VTVTVAQASVHSCKAYCKGNQHLQSWNHSLHNISHNGSTGHVNRDALGNCLQCRNAKPVLDQTYACHVKVTVSSRQLQTDCTCLLSERDIRGSYIDCQLTCSSQVLLGQSYHQRQQRIVCLDAVQQQLAHQYLQRDNSTADLASGLSSVADRLLAGQFHMQKATCLLKNTVS